MNENIVLTIFWQLYSHRKHNDLYDKTTESFSNVNIIKEEWINTRSFKDIIWMEWLIRVVADDLEMYDKQLAMTPLTWIISNNVLESKRWLTCFGNFKNIQWYTI